MDNEQTPPGELEQLRSTAEKYHQLFETLPVGWADHRMLFDEQGAACDYVFLMVNEAFERFTGLQREQILGRPVTEVIPGIRDADPDLIRLYGEVTRTGRQQSFELYFAPFERHYRVTAFRSREQNFSVIFEDVTAAKRIERRSRRMQHCLEATSDFVGMADAAGHTQYVNLAGRRLMGFTAEQDLSKLRMADFHPQEVASRLVAEGLPEALEQGIWEGDSALLSSTGQKIPASQVLLGLRDETGELDCFATIIRDMTRERQLRDQLQATLADLRRSNEELEQFAYVASHDLQEPLRMVASFTQLLARRYGGKLDERADKYINYAVDGARRMQGLIDDLLAFSRVGTQATPPASTDCAEVAEQVLRGLGRSIEESGASVHLGPLPVVLIDRSQLVQLLQNLIANAIKFCGEQPPRIEVTARRDGELWELCVADHGIGIEPRFHERVFSIFQRLHQRSEYPGSGIGLAIVKKIVERQGGSIRLESEAGAGARFYFTLPAGESEQGARA